MTREFWDILEERLRAVFPEFKPGPISTDGAIVLHGDGPLPPIVIVRLDGSVSWIPAGQGDEAPIGRWWPVDKYADELVAHLDAFVHRRAA
jgi:hypothetical protein